MKKLLKKICVSCFLLMSSSVFSMQGLSVITITTDDPEGYVEWLTKNSQVFQDAAGDDVSSSGICSPMAGGNQMNEHYVWSFHPSTSAMLSNMQFSTEDSQRAIRKISSKRDLVRRDMWSVMKGEAVGETGTTNDQILAADKKLNAFMDQGSSTGGISRWWPGSGIPSRFDADLLWVQSAESMTAWGRGADQAVNGGGNQVAQELYGELMTCTNREVFLADAVRISDQN